MYKTPSRYKRPTTQIQDQFPLLGTAEIAECLRSCEFTVSEEQISRPSAATVQTLYEQMLDTFQAVSLAETPEPLREAAQRAGLEEEEVPDSTGRTVVLMRAVARFMATCGVPDVCVLDIVRPEAERLRRQLSAAVNFARFREAHTADCAEIARESEDIELTAVRRREQYETVYAQVLQLQEDLAVSEDGDNEEVRALERDTTQAETELRQLKREQDRVVAEYAEYRKEKSALVAQLETQTTALSVAREELERLRTYVVEAPEVLERALAEMSGSVSSARTELAALEIRAQRLASAADTIRELDGRVRDCGRIAEEVRARMRTLEEVRSETNSAQEKFGQAQEEAADAEQRIALCRRRVGMAGEKVRRTMRAGEAKREGANTRVRVARERLTKTREEWRIGEEGMAKAKIRVLGIEKRMESKVRYCEDRMKAYRVETEKLKNHIEEYLSCMEPRIAF